MLCTGFLMRYNIFFVIVELVQGTYVIAYCLLFFCIVSHWFLISFIPFQLMKTAKQRIWKERMEGQKYGLINWNYETITSAIKVG